MLSIEWPDTLFHTLRKKSNKTSCCGQATGRWLRVVEESLSGGCTSGLVARVAFDAYFNNTELSRNVLCVDVNNSKDLPPLRRHVCLMSTQNGWLHLAKKLPRLFSPQKP